MNILDWVGPLTEMFVGKEVIVESISADGRNPRENKKVTGICKTFYSTSSSIDIELTNGTRYGFVPEVVSENSVEGKVSCLIALRRKIKLA